MRITIVGVGLIGGSLALALRRAHPGVFLTGIDRETALARLPPGLVDECCSADDGRARAAGLRGARVAFLCTPVRMIADALTEALELADIVTDCGSTKRAILAHVVHHPRRDRWVPGHPMAGAPQGGVDRARVDLFQGRRWILCPDGSHPEAAAVVEGLVRDTGADPVPMSTEDHDRAVALTSHVPQLLASALVVMAERRHDMPAAGPGFQSATRVAGGPEAMWLDIFKTNGDEVARALRELRLTLEEVERGLDEHPVNTQLALDLLARARQLRGH